MKHAKQRKPPARAGTADYNNMYYAARTLAVDLLQWHIRSLIESLDSAAQNHKEIEQ